MTLLYAVVCLMMLPYPQLVSDAGGGFDHVVQITLVMTLFTAAAGLSTWLLLVLFPVFYKVGYHDFPWSKVLVLV